MTDVEARLRETFRTALDPVTAEPVRGGAAIRRARRARAVRGIGAGLAGVLIAGAAAVALERGPERRRARPAAAPEQAATFRLDFGDGGDGTLTVDVPKAQVCTRVSRNLGGSHPQLRYFDGTSDVVVDYLLGRVRPVCQPLDPSDARRILDEPSRHYVWLGPGYQSVEGALVPLEVVPPLLPEVAEVVCSQDGAVAITPEVRAQEDGVHVRFHSDGNRWNAFNLLADDGGNEGGALVDGPFVTAFGPGPLYAGCFEHLNDAPPSPRDPAYTKITVLDPNDFWTEDDLDCDTPEEPRPIDTGEPRVDPEQLDAFVREHVPGIEPTDVLERPRYPETEFHFEPRTVVRDGRRIAGLLLVDGETSWEIAARVCPGSGIAE